MLVPLQQQGEFTIRDQKQPAKKQRFEQDDPSQSHLVGYNWMGLYCCKSDKEHLRNGRWLNDKHFNYAQSLLKKHFPHINGYNSTLLASKEEPNMVEQLGYPGNPQLWYPLDLHMRASTPGCCEDQVQIFNSLHTLVVHKDTRTVMLNISQIDKEPNVEMVAVHKQTDGNNNGLFAIAAATALVFLLFWFWWISAEWHQGTPFKVQCGWRLDTLLNPHINT